MSSQPWAKDVTTNPSAPVCSAILKWERGQVQAPQWQVQAPQWRAQAMQWRALWGWLRLRRMAPVLRSRAARESCACASVHPA